MLVPLVLHAVGVAFVFAPGTVAILQGVPQEHAGTASGLLQMDQQIGGALGIAAITSIYAFTAISGRFASGLPTAFVGGGLIALIAALIAWKHIAVPHGLGARMEAPS